MAIAPPDAQLAGDILHLIARETGARREAVQLDSRLVEDLGIAGDDAFELIRVISDRYPVDWAALKPHWVAYFGTAKRRVQTQAIMAGAFASGFGVMLWARFEPVWLTGTLLGLLFIVAADRGLHHARRHRGLPEPVTVRDLVEAVEAGRWVKPFRSSH